MIGTVRNVGYKFVQPDRDIEEMNAASGEADGDNDQDDDEDEQGDVLGMS
jgi:hypothetical protein